MALRKPILDTVGGLALPPTPRGPPERGSAGILRAWSVRDGDPSRVLDPSVGSEHGPGGSHGAPRGQIAGSALTAGPRWAIDGRRYERLAAALLRSSSWSRVRRSRPPGRLGGGDARPVVLPVLRRAGAATSGRPDEALCLGGRPARIEAGTVGQPRVVSPAELTAGVCDMSLGRVGVAVLATGWGFAACGGGGVTTSTAASASGDKLACDPLA